MAERALLTRGLWRRRRWRGVLSRTALGALCAACSRADARPDEGELRVWAFGAEGEALAPIAREFEQKNPGVHVRVQAIPWSAAHEKLLTAYVGGALPDVVQVGNTWIPELVALEAVLPVDEQVGDLTDVFPGILDTNVLDGRTLGVPWYADTRLLFYRDDMVRAVAGTSRPRTWGEWVATLDRVQARGGAGHSAVLLPLQEWQTPVILALQRGAPLLSDGDTRGAFA